MAVSAQIGHVSQQKGLRFSEDDYFGQIVEYMSFRDVE